MSTSTPSVLQKIVDAVLVRLRARQLQVAYAELQEKAASARTPHDFAGAFSSLKPGLKTIAEIKFTSPALGKLDSGDVNRAMMIASAYVRGGTTAISVLTEQDHFHGNLDYLRAIRLFHGNALLLMKDFILEEYQILEARVHGADCILLIVALLGKERSQTLLQFAQSLGLSVLVEVHDEEELTDALMIGATFVGINNRNLKTLDVSLDTSYRLIQKIQNPPTLISESGIKTALEMKSLAAAGFSGFLVGSSLMTKPDPGAALAQLLQEAGS